MNKVSKTQMFVIKNGYQGHFPKALCVCTAGILRSPTIATILSSDYGYNTRSCGSESSIALVPVSPALIEWADVIFFAEEENRKSVDSHYDLSDKNVHVLQIPDNFGYMEEPLIKIIKNRLKEIGIE